MITITLSGAQGVGKSTLAGTLVELLQQAGFSNITFDEDIGGGANLPRRLPIHVATTNLSTRVNVKMLISDEENLQANTYLEVLGVETEDDGSLTAVAMIAQPESVGHDARGGPGLPVAPTGH